VGGEEHEDPATADGQQLHYLLGRGLEKAVVGELGQVAGHVEHGLGGQVEGRGHHRLGRLGGQVQALAQGFQVAQGGGARVALMKTRHPS